MIVSLEETKQYLRLETEFVDEDALIQSLIGAAEAYLLNATGQIFDETNPLAKLLCFVLITDWYENREMVGKVNEQARASVRSIMAQLQNSYPLIQTTALPEATVGVPYEAHFNAIGGVTPYKWATCSGDLPDGLSLDERTGIVSGIPTVAGEAIVTAQITDSSPVPRVVRRPISVMVVEP